MQIKDIQNLIDNKLEPNAQEWAMDVEDILTELDALTPETIELLTYIKSHNTQGQKVFPTQADTVVAILKRIIGKIEKSSESIINGGNVVMTKENVFIVYSHQNINVMREIKEFIRENLGFEPKTLYIAECTGSVWDAFTEKSAECQKAIVLMSDDDEVTDANGDTYKQARPNVFIELGYMIHKCGLNNVTIIYSSDCKETSDVGCKEASDIGNLVSVHYGADKWTESLRKQLNR